MDPKDLAHKIDEAVGEMRSLVEKEVAEAKENAGHVSAETKEAMEKVQADITALMEVKEQNTKLQERIDDMELKMERSKLVAPGTGGDPKTEEQKAYKQSFFKWIRGGERALSPEEKKALVQDDVGRYIIEPELDAEIERILPQITIVRGLATVRSIGKDRIKMRSMGGVSVGWGKLETGTIITESDLTPGAPTYQYVEDLYGLAKIGEDELMDADVNLEGILAEEFSRALGEAEEAAFINGTGHDNEQPEGITQNTTLVADAVTAASAGDITVEDMLDIMYAVPTQYRRNGTFMVNSQTELALRKLRAGGSTTTDGPFLWQPSVQAGTPNTFLGKPIFTQDDMKTLSDAGEVVAIFGDIRSGYRIIDRVGMSLQRLTELYAESGLVGFKIHKRVTGGVRKASQKPIALLLRS